MGKHSNFLIHGFLFLSFSLLQSAQESAQKTVELPTNKRIIKKLINQYQINEETIYLAQLLSLDRITLEDKFTKSLTKYSEYKEQLQNEKMSHGSVHFDHYYSTDLKKIESKIKHIDTKIRVFRRFFGEDSEPYKNLLSRLTIDRQLAKDYKILIDNERAICLATCLESKKNNTITKMSLILAALYLTSISTNDLNKNKTLYKLLSMKFHPDKASFHQSYYYENDTNTIEEKTEFFKNLEPLLSSDKNSQHLNDILLAINNKKNDLSFTEKILHFAVDFNCHCVATLPIMGEALGVILGHKACTKLMPITQEENRCKNECIARVRNSALQIEAKLLGAKYKKIEININTNTQQHFAN